MKHLTTYKIFESHQPFLSDLDINWVRSHFDEDLFGKFDHHLEEDRGMIDIQKSKCLKLNDKIIGCYCLHESDMIEIIERTEYWTDKGTYKNLKFFIDRDRLDEIFFGKLGIFGDYLYILPEYRGGKYADILIDYSKTLGDYNWGITIGEKADKYWMMNKGRTRICEYEDPGYGKHILNSTLPK